MKEGQEAINEDATPEMRDVMLIGAARRVEHYEIAGYTAAYDIAKSLGLTTAIKSLSATLGEETTTDARLAKASSYAIAQAKAAGK